MADLRQKTCCFTGHRRIREKDLPSILERTEQTVRRLIEKGIVFFGVGGAIGYDTEVAKLLFRLRATDYPHIKVILVYPFEGFASCWSDEQRAEYIRLLPQYDKTVCVAQNVSKEAYLKRNKHLVNGSAYCVAYCVRSCGGTAYTLRYAKQRGLVIYNMAP